MKRFHKILALAATVGAYLFLKSVLEKEPETEVRTKEWPAKPPERDYTPIAKTVPEPPGPEPESETETDANLPMLQEIDLSFLKNMDHELVGWFYVPETGISCPIIWDPHGTEEKTHIPGYICLNTSNGKDFTDVSSQLTTDSRLMAMTLLSFLDKGFAKNHQKAYVRTETAVMDYSLVSAYGVAEDMPVNVPADRFETMLRQISEKSAVDLPTKGTEDRLLTLTVNGETPMTLHYLFQKEHTVSK